jgi:hypothetical protein
MSIPDPDHLLDQAERLIASTGGGTARHVDLRRAISNAYYALFHAVTAQTVDDFIGSSHRKTQKYRLVYRSIEHRALRDLCEDIVNPSASLFQLCAGWRIWTGPQILCRRLRSTAGSTPFGRLRPSLSCDEVERGQHCE